MPQQQLHACVSRQHGRAHMQMHLQAAGAFAKGLQQIDGLQLAGQPAMTVVAFKARKPRRLNIYALNDLMSQRGWHLSALQLPPALHMCFTGQHTSIMDSLLKVPSQTSPFAPVLSVAWRCGKICAVARMHTKLCCECMRSAKGCWLSEAYKAKSSLTVKAVSSACRGQASELRASTGALELTGYMLCCCRTCRSAWTFCRETALA